MSSQTPDQTIRVLSWILAVTNHTREVNRVAVQAVRRLQVKSQFDEAFITTMASWEADRFDVRGPASSKRLSWIPIKPCQNSASFTKGLATLASHIRRLPLADSLPPTYAFIIEDLNPPSQNVMKEIGSGQVAVFEIVKSGAAPTWAETVSSLQSPQIHVPLYEESDVPIAANWIFTGLDEIPLGSTAGRGQIPYEPSWQMTMSRSWRALSGNMPWEIGSTEN